MPEIQDKILNGQDRMKINLTPIVNVPDKIEEELLSVKLKGQNIERKERTDKLDKAEQQIKNQAAEFTSKIKLPVKDEPTQAVNTLDITIETDKSLGLEGIAVEPIIKPKIFEEITVDKEQEKEEKTIFQMRMRHKSALLEDIHFLSIPSEAIKSAKKYATMKSCRFIFCRQFLLDVEKLLNAKDINTTKG